MAPKMFKMSSAEKSGFPNVASVDVAPGAWHHFKCSACSREGDLIEGPVHLYSIESGNKWPDFLRSGSVGPLWFVSKRVVDALTALDGKAFTAYPALIKEIRDRRLESVPPPEYFHLKIHGRIDMDLAASKAQFQIICPVCCRADTAYRKYDRFIVDKSTWDGSHLFAPRNYPSHMVFCTLEVLLVARKYRWTNCRFLPVDVPLIGPLGWSIDYLGKKWPPQWYPEGMEPAMDWGDDA